MSVSTRRMDLNNDTAINVVALLKEPVGSTRIYPLRLDTLSLDGESQATAIAGEIRLTRLRDEILATVRARGVVELECVRCLQAYAQGFETEFSAEFRPTVDVRTGSDLDEPDDEDERFTIDENHELDVAEPLRQEILVALPMRATCGDLCPGPDMAGIEGDSLIDDRFAALSRLLDDETATDGS